MPVPLAHFGHVLIDAPIFMGPVVLLTVWVLWMSRRDKRRAERGPVSRDSDSSEVV